MLVLERKVGERLMFGDRLSVELLEIFGNGVKLRVRQWNTLEMFVSFGERRKLRAGIHLRPLDHNGSTGIRFGLTAPRDVKILREELWIIDQQAAADQVKGAV